MRRRKRRQRREPSECRCELISFPLVNLFIDPLIEKTQFGSSRDVLFEQERVFGDVELISVICQYVTLQEQFPKAVSDATIEERYTQEYSFED